MKQFKLINNLAGWFSFLVAAIVYLLTIEPTTSLWDCGEFISSAYKLEVGHPPGAPFFMLLGRFFSLFASSPENVAKMMNSLSALASAATILFLFWTITHFARKILVKDGNFSNGKMVAIIGSGLVGALAYTFSDTFWFSAVEAEVYALSSFFTAIVFWAILKWEEASEQKFSNRWLIFIAYMMGLSIGVHLLNLLAIPAIVFVYYFKKYDVSKKATEGFLLLFALLVVFFLAIAGPGLIKVIFILGFVGIVIYFFRKKYHLEEGFTGIIIATAISAGILGAVMYIVIPGFVKVATAFEVIFVNGFNLPFHSGVLIYVLLIIGLIVWSLRYTQKNGKVIANTVILMTTMILIGYSSFATIVIRSYANPPMDENNPEDAFSLLNYLNREQYGSRPLFHGQYYNAPIVDSKEKQTRIRKNGKYIRSYLSTEYVYHDDFKTLFPRMYSNKPEHIEDYKSFGKVEGVPVKIRNQQGKEEVRYKPTMSENLRFLVNYQIGYMYMRYFMWNFVGRQDDIQGNGGILHGNWISGIKFIDEALIGPLDNISEQHKNNHGRNAYYFLPLILGLVGFFFQLKNNNKDFTVVVWLFFMTGLAIVLYLNQYPQQPRERDYAYAASFYAFAIWIGLGVLAFYDLLTKQTKVNGKLAAIGLTALWLIAVPAVMASENWDDHDRSGRYSARDFAQNYLNTCEENAILFTNGDNDTFPLWYAQEVEGIRTDVRVCNLSLLGTDWYIDQMQKQAYESDPVPFTMTHDQYVQGTRDVIYVIDQLKDKYTNLKDIINFVGSDDKRTKYRVGQDEYIDYLPGKKFYIPVDKQKVISNGTVPQGMEDQIADTIFFTLNKDVITKNELMVLDLLANFEWDRPIYFVSVGGDGDLGLRTYLQQEGFAYRLVPIRSNGTDFLTAGRIQSDILYDNLMNKFKWGNLNDPDVLVDYYNTRTLSVLRIRHTFYRLATTLIEENQSEKAVEALDKVVELFPHEKMPYGLFMIDIIEAYYKAGANEKALEISKDMLAIYSDNLDYYMDICRDKGATLLDYDNQVGLHIMQRLITLSGSYGEIDFAKSAEEAFNIYYRMYADLQNL